MALQNWSCLVSLVRYCDSGVICRANQTNLFTDAREDTDDGELEQDQRDWDKEVINPNLHPELKLPSNGVTYWLLTVYTLLLLFIINNLITATIGHLDCSKLVCNLDGQLSSTNNLLLHISKIWKLVIDNL